MADLSEFEAIRPPVNGRLCWFAHLTDEQKDKVTKAKESGYSGEVIAKVVSSWGTPIKLNSIYVHFRGSCACS